MHIVDIHIHSHFSRATSPEMNIQSLYSWGKKKGITVMGTGDFTHPGWFAELQEKMQPAESGLFTLHDSFAKQEDSQLPSEIRQQSMRFLLTVEISTIYSKAGRVRKLHTVIVAPSFVAAAKINAKLSQIGNLQADGRPILGLDTAELLKIALDADPDCLVVPAHIWTPWFGMFGSKSGFDSLEETFGDLAKHIYAIETGLSSDPAMNWRVANLDKCTIVSNSDAHSPRKLGREANLIDCELNYEQIIGAMKTNDHRMVGTIEFYPEEGKYHYNGHRSCGISMSPEESAKIDNICPVCGKPLVLGVDYRVSELATRKVGYQPHHTKKVEYIIPLEELVMHHRGVKSAGNKGVQTDYELLLTKFGNEFKILREIDTTEISQGGFPWLATAIAKMRAGEVERIAGYDGVFGIIKVKEDEHESGPAQIGFGF